MKRWIKWTLRGTGLVGVVAAVWAAASQPFLLAAHYKAPADLASRHDALIRRDRYGVPHVLSKTDADAAFGLAYAHAEDDFDTLQLVLASTRGRAAEIGGMDAVGLDYLARLVRVRETVSRKYVSDLAPATRKFVEGYADGLNLYASSHPGEVKLRGLFPITGADVIALSAGSATFFSRAYQTIGALAANEPLPPGSPPKSRGGSNSFAVAPAKSSDGSTWLVSNSHQPWAGPFAWYEAQVTSREGLDFAGVLFPGLSMPVTGHNRSLGWTNTSNYPQLTNVYRLDVDAGGQRYRLDGRWLPLGQESVWLWVKYGLFQIPVRKTIYSSVHGPVIKNDQGYFAVRCSCFGEIRHTEQYYRMAKAQTFDDWFSAMSILAMPSFNYTYADKTGKIGLFYNAKLPHRRADVEWSGILAGNTSKTIWNQYWSFKDLPRIVDPRAGYIAESNSTPFDAGTGPGDQIHRKDYPRDFLIEPEITNRSRRALALFDSTPRVAFADLWRIKFDTGIDPKSDQGGFFRQVLQRDYRKRPDLAKGQALLRSWDWKLDGKGPADALAALLSEVADDAILARADFPDADKALGEALAFLTANYHRIDPPLRSILRLRRGRYDLPLAGAGDTLRAFYWNRADDGRLVGNGGDSFIMFTRWNSDGEVSAQSVQPFGSATLRPNSPHYDDQAPLFAAGRFKPAWFSEADVRRNTVRQYRPK